jgi:hypothetical protein
MIDDPIVATLARGQLYELTVALYSWAKSAQGCVVCTLAVALMGPNLCCGDSEQQGRTVTVSLHGAGSLKAGLSRIGSLNVETVPLLLPYSRIVSTLMTVLDPWSSTARKRSFRAVGGSDDAI